MEAQFQADLNWAKNELLKIKDPNFLERITNLLKERPSTFDDDIVTEKLVTRALKSQEDIKEGRVYDFESAEKRVKKHLGL